MRLLNVDDLNLTEFRDERKRPKYVIASHRWSDDEVTLKDVQKRRNTQSIGYKKVEAFASYVRHKIPSIKWLWIDTCCIDKKNSIEVQYAINSMFTWYRDAQLCIAHLADIETKNEAGDLTRSNWFTRGWTLQELLAPRIVVFVTNDWQVIGNKGSDFNTCEITELGADIAEHIAECTKLPHRVLKDWAKNTEIPVLDKIAWMECRETTIEEDRWYALFGIVGVTPGTNYGEGSEQAKGRLFAGIQARAAVAHNETEEFQKIKDWLSAPDPRIDHRAAQKMSEPETGKWLLESSQYQGWKSGKIRYLWLRGKAGCGKTILSSTAIEDMKSSCLDEQNLGHAFFYFSFSDSRKQSFEHLVRSLLQQLGSDGPAQSILRNEYKRLENQSVGLEELQQVLVSCMLSYNMVFLHIDALDECPESNEERQHTLKGLKQLFSKAPNVSLLMASRSESDIRLHVEEMNGLSLEITPHLIHADIAKYVKTQVSGSARFSRLSGGTIQMIEDSLLAKANGMFRWVYCQLQELQKSKSNRPSDIKMALGRLPQTLDETYERMLLAINEWDRQVACTFLRWISCASRPLKLIELVETNIIDFSDPFLLDGKVNRDNRGCWEDTVDILAGLVTTDSDCSLPSTTVQLAHFSVQEYLESNRILESSARDFHIIPALAHQFVTQSCLGYLTHWISISDDSSDWDQVQRSLLEEDDTTLDWALLGYAAREWPSHALHHQNMTATREMRFLVSASCTDKGIMLIHALDPQLLPEKLTKPSLAWCVYFGSSLGLTNVVTAAKIAGADVSAWEGPLGQALHAASFNNRKDTINVSLASGADVNAQGGDYSYALQAASVNGYTTDTVKVLLAAGADVNSQGGYYGCALQAASYNHNTDTVRVLLAAGADVNAQGGYYGCALQAASHNHNTDTVRVLLAAGADVNTQGGRYSCALQAASAIGHTDTVKVLLAAGADVNAQGGDYGCALQAASYYHNTDIVKVLLAAGADVNAQRGRYGCALQAASLQGHTDIVIALLAAGADVNAQGGDYGCALQAASYNHNTDTIRVLLAAGADVNAQGGRYGCALQAALVKGHTYIAMALLAAGANVNTQGGYYGCALQAASMKGYTDIVIALLAAGADVNAQGGDYGYALQAALAESHTDTVKVLLAAGADINAQGGRYGCALQAASLQGYTDVVKALLAAGADVNAQGGYYGCALQAASIKGHTDIVKALLAAGAQVNAQGGQYDTALQAAASSPSTDIVKILLAAGANVNSRGGMHGNALRAAIYSCKCKVTSESNKTRTCDLEKLVEMLVNAGAIIHKHVELRAAIEATNRCYGLGQSIDRLTARAWNPVYSYAFQVGKDNDILTMLQEAQSTSPNVDGKEYGWQLRAACQQGERDKVKILLAKIVNAPSQDAKGGTEL